MARKMMFGERRLHERKSCTFAVDINDHIRIYSCHLRDLSRGGALVEYPPHFEPNVGQELLLTIPYRKKPGAVIVKGRVVRARFGRIAVAFL
jgi:Tfp pilus assembly protein PilZ